MTNDG